jgi:hypothetical protein
LNEISYVAPFIVRIWHSLLFKHHGLINIAFRTRVAHRHRHRFLRFLGGMIGRVASQALGEAEFEGEFEDEAELEGEFEDEPLAEGFAPPGGTAPLTRLSGEVALDRVAAGGPQPGGAGNAQRPGVEFARMQVEFTRALGRFAIRARTWLRNRASPGRSPAKRACSPAAIFCAS